MIKSMTAFGRGCAQDERRRFTVEVRSVNSRYLDAAVRLPRAYLGAEDKIRTYLQKNVISRGKVEVFVTVEDTAAPVVELDMDYARAYVDALRRLAKELALPEDISVMKVAQNPEIFRKTAEEGREEDSALLLAALREACGEFDRMRTAEGQRLAADFTEKLAGVERLREEIAALSGKDVCDYREKLTARLRKVLGENGISADEGRVLTECALFADRVAIDEELVRLQSHLHAFAGFLQAGEPVGRKLDFLMQEMNREINTVGSKCQNVEITSRVVAVKNELEKIREQVQNVE